MPLGVAAAMRPGSLVDHACRIVTTAGVSLPTFFTGLLLVYVFYYLLGLAPAPLGRLDVTPPRRRSTPGSIWSTACWPETSRPFARRWRSSSCRRRQWRSFRWRPWRASPAPRCCRCSAASSSAPRAPAACRGAGSSVVYAFRNAVLPVITTLGMVFSFLLGANVLVEKVFAWPGIGSYAVDALIASDYAPVQGFVLLMALLYVASIW